MGVLQHHDAITGTEQQHVADDYTMTLAHSQFKSNKVYSQLLKEKMKQITGLSSDQVVTCPQNETVAACPQAKESLKSFVVISHNQQAHSNKQLVRILLPSNKYTAMVWSKDQLKFVDSQNFDILEQPHFKQGANKNGETESDFMMFVDLPLLPNEVGFVKVVQTTSDH